MPSFRHQLFGAASKGNELTRAMSMGAQQVLQSHPSRYRSSTGVSGKHLTAADKTAAFMRLRLCRAAYQCMTTVVVCTQRLEKFYCDLLFKEDSHVLWDNLVDDVTPFDSLPFPVEPTFANGVCVFSTASLLLRLFRALS